MFYLNISTMANRVDFSVGLVEGETYIIDKKFNNGGEVVLMKIYGRIFCKVKDPETGTEWDTMMNRLSPIE